MTGVQGLLPIACLLLLLVSPAAAAEPPSLPAASAPFLARKQEAIDWLGSYSRLQFVEDSLGNATDPGQVAAKARYAAGAAAALEGACPAGNGSAATGTAAPGRRRNLVVSIVGDTWDEGTWLDRPEAATFSVVAIYYGSNRSYSCAPCAATVHWRGPKWRLIGQLMANATHAGLLESITPPGGFDYV
jgi:hypothetical protein